MKNDRTSSASPVGDLCVLRAEHADEWAVRLCSGNAESSKPLAVFRDRGEANAFAIAERDRRLADEGVELRIHFPDDCPCYCQVSGGESTKGRGVK